MLRQSVLVIGASDTFRFRNATLQPHPTGFTPPATRSTSKLTSLVSLNCGSVQPPAPATLVERYVVDWVQGREGNPILLVTSQPGFDLPAGGGDIRIGDHNLVLRCSCKAGSYHGGRYVIDARDQPLLAKQGPDTYEVETEVL